MAVCATRITFVFLLSLALSTLSNSWASDVRASRKVGIFLECFYKTGSVGGAWHLTSNWRVSAAAGRTFNEGARVYSAQVRYYLLKQNFSPAIGLGYAHIKGDGKLAGLTSSGSRPFIVVAGEWVHDAGFMLGLALFWAFQRSPAPCANIGFFF